MHVPDRLRTLRHAPLPRCICKKTLIPTTKQVFPRLLSKQSEKSKIENHCNSSVNSSSSKCKTVIRIRFPSWLTPAIRVWFFTRWKSSANTNRHVMRFRTPGIRFLNGPKKIEDPAKFSTWSFRIIHNKSFDSIRSNIKPRNTIDKFPKIRSTTVDINNELDAAEKQRWIIKKSTMRFDRLFLVMTSLRKTNLASSNQYLNKHLSYWRRPTIGSTSGS